MNQCTSITPKVLLQVKDLCKSYHDKPVVQKLSLSIARGECLALLGPNGAGKTTTLEMLEGLVTPDSGAIEFFGKPLAQNPRAIKERIGVVLQEANLYKRYTVLETVQLYRSFYQTGVPPQLILEALELSSIAHSQVRHLSGGQKQRLVIGCALVHDPDLLFLDEPTTGLDPHQRHALWQILTQLLSGQWQWSPAIPSKARGILLTTHSMEEAAFLATNVAILEQGRLVALGPPADLVKSHVGSQVMETREATLEDVYLKLTGQHLAPGPGPATVRAQTLVKEKSEVK